MHYSFFKKIRAFVAINDVLHTSFAEMPPLRGWFKIKFVAS